MISKLVKIIILNIVILLSFQLTFADTPIYPKKKPSLSKETLKKKKISNLIIPKIKPDLVKKEKIKMKDYVEQLMSIIEFLNIEKIPSIGPPIKGILVKKSPKPFILSESFVMLVSDNQN